MRDGRDAAARGDHLSAVARHEEGLALVRGAPLADLTELPFAREAATRIAEVVLAAHEGLADARLATGQHAEVVESIAGLVRAHPLRERFHAQLILALYRSGRQADALRAFQEARRVLVDELGVEPGHELQDLERVVLAHDPALEATPMPGARSAASGPARSKIRDDAAGPGFEAMADRLPLVGPTPSCAACARTWPRPSPATDGGSCWAASPGSARRASPRSWPRSGSPRRDGRVGSLLRRAGRAGLLGRGRRSCRHWSPGATTTCSARRSVRASPTWPRSSPRSRNWSPRSSPWRRSTPRRRAFASTRPCRGSCGASRRPVRSPS